MKFLVQSLFLVVTVFSVHINGNSQNIEVSVGPTHKMENKTAAWADVEYLGSDNSYLYYILHSFSKIYSGPYIGSKDTYIGKVDKEKMQLIKVEVLPLEFEGKEVALEFGFDLNGKGYIFTSFQNNSQKKAYLFVQTLDTRTLRVNDDLKKIAEIDYSNESKYNQMAFNYKISSDESKVLITHNLLDKEGTLLRFGYTLTDTNLNALGSSTKLALPEKGIYSFQFFNILNDGNVYLLTKYFKDKREYKKNLDMKKQGLLSGTRSMVVNPNYQYRILEFKDFSATPRVYEVELDNLFATSLDFVRNKAGDLITIGFYSDDEDATPDGVFTKKLTCDKKLMSKSLEGQFSEPSKYTNDTYVAVGLFKKRDDLTNFRFVIKDIIYRENEGFVFTGERLTTLTKTQQNAGGGATTTVRYHTDDIIVIDVKEDGQINWTTKIEKGQVTSSLYTMFNSYTVFEHNNNLLVYYTNFGNENTKFIGKVVDTESNLVQINPQGEQTKKVLFTAEKNDITLKAKRSYEINDGNFVLYGHNGIADVGFVKVEVR